MQKEADISWLDNEFSAETKRLFKIINIVEGGIIWTVIVLLTIIFSSLIFLLVGVLVHILFFIPIYMNLHRAPIKVGVSLDCIRYIKRDGSEGLILWDNIHSFQPMPMTAKREYVLIPMAGIGRHIYLNREVAAKIKKRWEEYRQK